MKKEGESIFDLEGQQHDVSGKIVVGLERISEAFRALLWEKGNDLGLTPIQIQILIFVRYHKEPYCSVSYLAKEFNLTKATVSDAVSSLESKGYLEKSQSDVDKRSWLLLLTQTGKKIISSVEDFAFPVKQKVNQLKKKEKQELLNQIIHLVFKLNQSGIISVQRTCYACKFIEKLPGNPYCHYLETNLSKTEIRLDCPEFESVE